MRNTLYPIKSSLRRKMVIGFIVFVSIPLLFFEFVLFRSWLGTTRDIVVHQYETILNDSTEELRHNITTMEKMNDYIYRDYQQDTVFYDKLKAYSDGSSLRNDPYLNAVFSQLSNQFFGQNNEEMIFSYLTIGGDLIYQRSNRAGKVHFLSFLSQYDEETWFQQIDENGPVNTVLSAHRSLFQADYESIYFSFGQVIRSPVDLQPVGVSLLTVNASVFEKLLKSPSDQKWIKTIVTDQHGNLMFTNDPSEPISSDSSHIYKNTMKPYNWEIKAYLSNEQLSQSYIVPMIQNNGLFVIGNIIMLAAIIGFMTRQLKPLYILADKMKKAKEGHFYVKIGKYSSDELGMLSEVFNDMTSEIQRLFDNQKTEYQEKLHFQMKALETQINPHFIYNMLDLIQSRVFDAKPDEASELIVSLSVIMRYTTTRPGEKVMFEEEIKWLNDYIYLQQQLIGRNVNVRLEIDERVMTCKVHKLILQPVIENVFIHGFEVNKEPFELLIRAYFEEGWICFEIADNGKGFSSMVELELTRENVDELKNWGTGLYVTAQRFLLQTEYAVIYIQSAPEAGTQVIMKQILCD